MLDDDLFRALQQDLDRMPVGFPPTASAVELRILRQLFSPIEARIALCLNLLPEPLAAIRKRIHFAITPELLHETLDAMTYRGLIRKEDDQEGPRYGKLPFVIGIYEGQVDRMSEQLARDLIEYFDSGLGQAVRPKITPQLRTVPVNQPVAAERGVARYDDIRASVRKCEGPFAVMNCICRQARDLAGDPCRQTKARSNCLAMGAAAAVMIQHDRARLIPREQMLSLLDDADREGLVLQPQNTRNPLFICCCCGCCCVALRAAKQLPRPVEFFRSNYYAEVHRDDCQSCGECIQRCQMEAVASSGAGAVVDLERCIGCGLCVSTCPSGAMTLHRKPRPARPALNTNTLYAQIYRERFGNGALAKAVAQVLTHRKA